MTAFADAGARAGVGWTPEQGGTGMDSSKPASGDRLELLMRTVLLLALAGGTFWAYLDGQTVF